MKYRNIAVPIIISGLIAACSQQTAPAGNLPAVPPIRGTLIPSEPILPMRSTLEAVKAKASELLDYINQIQKSGGLAKRVDNFRLIIPNTGEVSTKLLDQKLIPLIQAAYTFFEQHQELFAQHGLTYVRPSSHDFAIINRKTGIKALDANREVTLNVDPQPDAASILTIINLIPSQSNKVPAEADWKASVFQGVCLAGIQQDDQRVSDAICNPISMGAGLASAGISRDDAISILTSLGTVDLTDEGTSGIKVPYLDGLIAYDAFSRSSGVR